MTVKEHIRMTALGTLPGGEMFSFGLAIGRPGAFEGGGVLSALLLEPNNAVWDDLRDDLATYWAALPISSRAVLKTVKFAPIGTNGRYSGPAIERTIGGSTGQSGTMGSPIYPNQVALAVTTHAVADLGRVKGRWYLPVPAVTVASDGTIAEGTRDEIETASQQFLNNVNNQPGLDVLQLHAVIASSGRHNEDGSVKIPHDNHPIVGVTVGRVLDTQRRRRNKIREFAGTQSVVTGQG